MKIDSLDITKKSNLLPVTISKREAKHIKQMEVRELRKEVAHLQSSVNILGQLFAQINYEFEALKKKLGD